jgi:hypothetical protein
MARRTPLIAPGSVLAAREDASTESVLDDVIGTHRRRKGIDPPLEESMPENHHSSPNTPETKSESKNVRKSESLKERKNETNQESLKERKNDPVADDLIEVAALHSIRPGAELTPWGTRLPRALKKRLDYQAFRLKEHKVTGQGLTIFALEKLLAELEAQEQEEE